MESKKALRRLILERRGLLDTGEIAESDRQVMNRLLALPEYRQAKVVFSFVSTEDEIDTRPVILDALAGGKRVCVPLCISLGVMRAYEIMSLDDLQSGKYGILEPKEGCGLVDPAEIDFAVVPCVTCNTKGHRLGYGGGFYDRYLEGRQFVKAALCREALLYESIPLENHDIPVDIVVTDRGIYFSDN